MNSQCSGGFIFIDRDEEWFFGSRGESRTPPNLPYLLTKATIRVQHSKIQ